MRVLRILMILFLMTLNAYGAVVPTSVSGGTVDFTTRSPAQAASVNSTGQTVTFNSVTKHLWFQNDSTTIDCYINIEGKPTDDYTGSLDVYTVRVPAAGNVTPSVVELDFATKRLSFWSPDGIGAIRWIVTGDAGDL